MGSDKEIKPRLNKSLVQLDIEELIEVPDLLELDIANWLWQGLVVKEDIFRDAVKNHNWKQYAGKDIAIQCSVDAVIPTWALMLVAAKASELANEIFRGSYLEVRTKQYLSALSDFKYREYEGARVVLKGCSEIGDEVYVRFVQGIRPYAKTILFGEPCSTVPIYKK